MKRYVQHYVAKQKYGRWIIEVITWDNLRTYGSGLISRTFKLNVATRQLAHSYLTTIYYELLNEYGKYDEISFAQTQKTICVTHIYD